MFVTSKDIWKKVLPPPIMCLTSFFFFKFCQPFLMLYTINDCLTGETMCTYAQLYIMSITVYVSGKA